MGQSSRRPSDFLENWKWKTFFYLETSLEDLSGTDSIGKLGGIGVDGGVVLGVDGTALVNWLTNDVDDAAEGGWADWDLKRVWLICTYSPRLP